MEDDPFYFGTPKCFKPHNGSKQLLKEVTRVQLVSCGAPEWTQYFLELIKEDIA